MISVSAPGSLMLMGEHAVLHGQLALALAVEQRVTVELKPRGDRQICIESVLGDYHSSLDELTPEPRFSFMVEAIRAQIGRLTQGFSLSVEAGFSHQVGLGSSAAVTAATVAALAEFCGESLSAEQLFERALAVVHKVQQGRGSGTDLVASIFGGLVAYRVTPREIRRLPGTPDIDLFYVGYKMKTPEVIRHVETLAQGVPELYQQIYQLMGTVSERSEAAILAADWPLLGRLMNLYSGLMDALGVCDRSLADLQYQLRAAEQVLGVKISGSGLGDSVLTLGRVRSQVAHYQRIPVAVCSRGLEIHNPLQIRQSVAKG